MLLVPSATVARTVRMLLRKRKCGKYRESKDRQEKEINTIISGLGHGHDEGSRQNGDVVKCRNIVELSC